MIFYFQRILNIQKTKYGITLIRAFSTQIQEIREYYQDSTIKKIMEKFLCNMIVLQYDNFDHFQCPYAPIAMPNALGNQ